MNERKNRRNPLSHWCHNHISALLTSIREMCHNPIATLLTLIVIGIAVSLPSGLYVLLKNFESISHQWQYTPNITLYLQTQTPVAAINSLQSQLKQNPQISSIRYISPQQGLSEFSQHGDFAPVVAQLNNNPLPPVIIVNPKNTDPQQLQLLQNQLKNLPSVASAQLNIHWIKRLFNLITLGQRIVFTLAAVFSLGVIFIIGNTIRLTMQQHRQEMTVLKLIGATSRFIRRPFLYRGILLGLLGGAFGWLLIVITLWWLSAPAQALAASYHHSLPFSGISGDTTLMIVIASSLFGLIGAWFAAQRMLSTIE